jgi:excisionase family DNA binding protein
MWTVGSPSSSPRHIYNKRAIFGSLLRFVGCPPYLYPKLWQACRAIPVDLPGESSYCGGVAQDEKDKHILPSPKTPLSENLIGMNSVPQALPDDSPLLMTPDEAAVFLRLSKSTLYRLVERRSLRFFRVSGVLRFDRRDVEAFVRQGLVEPLTSNNL